MLFTFSGTSGPPVSRDKERFVLHKFLLVRVTSSEYDVPKL